MNFKMTWLKWLSVIFLVLFGLTSAIVHRYPAYRGRVLEMGSELPIAGAGVLATYDTFSPSPGGEVYKFLNFQAVLTDEEGYFEIPARFMWTFRPIAWFEKKVPITIYKDGYGYFPSPSKYSQVTPEVKAGSWLKPNIQHIIHLKKLETVEEIFEARRKFHAWLPLSVKKSSNKFPPPGTTQEQFGIGLKYRNNSGVK